MRRSTLAKGQDGAPLLFSCFKANLLERVRLGRQFAASGRVAIELQNVSEDIGVLLPVQLPGLSAGIEVRILSNNSLKAARSNWRENSHTQCWDLIAAGQVRP